MNKKHDSLILIAIACTLLIFEIGIRVFENKLSGNLNHINEIPEIVEQYTQDERPKILFLGNSLINEAVDVEQLSNSLSGSFLVDKITPDATSLWDWNMIMKNDLFSAGAKIDYLVIGFAWGLMTDQYNPNPSRLGGYFAGLDDGFLLHGFGMDGFGELSEFVIGWFSKLFVNREAVRNKVLVNLIPHYEQFVRAQNQAGRPDETERTNQSQKLDYEMLSNLLDRLDKDGVKLIVIAMPIDDNYVIDKKLSGLLQARSYQYLDQREFFRKTNAVYKDGVHLNEKGKRLFTKALEPLFRQSK
jgi:hypothetical protein